jgi:hypothetical protein
MGFFMFLPQAYMDDCLVNLLVVLVFTVHSVLIGAADVFALLLLGLNMTNLDTDNSPLVQCSLFWSFGFTSILLVYRFFQCWYWSNELKSSLNYFLSLSIFTSLCILSHCIAIRYQDNNLRFAIIAHIVCSVLFCAENYRNIKKAPQPIYLSHMSRHICDNDSSCSICPCAICLDTMNEQDIASLPCAHSFHKPCIDKWFITKTTCPMCRDIPQNV